MNSQPKKTCVYYTSKFNPKPIKYMDCSTEINIFTAYLKLKKEYLILSSPELDILVTPVRFICVFWREGVLKRAFMFSGYCEVGPPGHCGPHWRRTIVLSETVTVAVTCCRPSPPLLASHRRLITVTVVTLTAIISITYRGCRSFAVTLIFIKYNFEFDLFGFRVVSLKSS